MHALKSGLPATVSDGELSSVGAALVDSSLAPPASPESSRSPQAVSARAIQPATSVMRAVFFTASS